MKLPNRVLILWSVLLLPIWQPTMPAPPPKAELVFVYLHGIGGPKEKPRFCDNMRRFLAEVDYPCRVRNYVWDSAKVDIRHAGDSWRESERHAEEEAPKFKARVIDALEKRQTPYVLIGFSVGTRVILRALERSKGGLRMLRGVYFLGSAMTHDTTLSPDVLPAGMKIVNYHSPHRDRVHQFAFSYVNDLPAGGQTGFTDTRVFDNYAVACTHAHKGLGIPIDYSQLACAIGYVALFREGVFIPGEDHSNLEWRVGQGKVWWNKILCMPCEVDGKPRTVEIEQNAIVSDYFRALVLDPDGTRTRIARGRNMHAILHELEVVPPSHWRHGKPR
ncbi:MAG: hypothetical protein JXR37_04230 [Kiritimatiellae bacterium]|nr:hypothetical protein [Kiritimatiellia bacterium]